MHLRRQICRFLSVLRIHNPDCEHCNTGEAAWGEMRQRLEELSWGAQPPVLKHANHGEIVEIRGSKLPKF